jgi:DNA-directed RNA polymerase subunit RPC12/RpoP
VINVVNKKLTKKTGTEWMSHVSKGYVYVTAVVLGVIGLFLLSTVWATRENKDLWLNGPNALLGLSNRTVLLLAGVLHVGLCVFLFATRNLTNKGLAILWAGLNHFIYRVGLEMTHGAALRPMEQFIAWRLQVRLATAAVIWKLLIAYLIAGSVLFGLLLWRTVWRLKKESYFISWQKQRAAEQEREKPPGPKTPKTGHDYIKILCISCGQKIAFPRSRTGESIACPHCTIQITLESPPQG